ncbi:hypothetical protein [Desulfocurvus vexinensis]|uniref:hypothetical protein n=1 Tax=Desulfocurvus vexinensis TaxID=399548 RepID=UPI000491754E|nr:hypothetical protein [Desulfocurvus vexinensis]
MANKVVVYCWRNGKIDFGNQLPKGALPIARDFSKRLRDAVEVLAVHGYDGETLIVPGLPTASSGDEALQALTTFREMVRAQLN